VRIAHLTYSFMPVLGGADRYLLQLFQVLRQAGHEQVVYQRHTSASEPFLRPLRPLPPWLKRGEFWLVPVLAGFRRRELRQYDRLIVHYAPYLLACPHPRAIVISHGVFWDDRPGALRSRIKGWATRRAYRRAWRFVANDTNMLREMGEKIGPGEKAFERVAPGKWFVPNCVDTRFYQRVQPDSRLAGTEAIVVVRNLYRNRGIDLAIRAFARFAERALRAVLVIVGREGQAGYLLELKTLAERLGVEDKVIFLGRCDWQQTPAIYSAARMSLVTSVAGEGTSLSALESMACGTPVVATKVGGLLDLPCVHSDPKDYALAEAMGEVWEHWQDYGQRQRQQVVESFNLERWREAWLRIVER